MRQCGFGIIYLDGNYRDVDTKKFSIPPKIINHKPDVVGEKNSDIFCIGEAKTENDIFTERTKKQIVDFFSIVQGNSENKLILGIPIRAKENLNKVLSNLRVIDSPQVDIILVPEQLLPNEEDT